MTNFKELAMRNISIGLCQLESHPAFYINNYHQICEPFKNEKFENTISYLATKGLPVDVIQEQCKKEYTNWQNYRIKSILYHIEMKYPDLDLIVFPEGSIPIESLTSIYEWSSRTKICAFAGSHTFLNQSNSLKIYEDINIPKNKIERIKKDNYQNVLPIVRYDRVSLVPKVHPSVFEVYETSKNNRSIKEIKPVKFIFRGEEIYVLPLICSEALQLPNIRKSYDIVVLISYDSKPEQFKPFFDTQITNKKMVVYCNDGRYGGTNFNVVVDKRNPNWYCHALPNGLPYGDNLIFGEIDIDAGAVEVGTAVPQKGFRLISVAPIVYTESPMYRFYNEVLEIKNINEASVRAESLKTLLKKSEVDPLSLISLNYLKKLDFVGASSSEWWEIFTNYCEIKGYDLRQIESELSSLVLSNLDQMMSNIAMIQDSKVALSYMNIIQECKSRGGTIKTEKSQIYKTVSYAIVDRDEEVNRINLFFNDESKILLEINGLQEIGKSSILTKAISQSGYTKICEINVSDSSSIDYLLYSIFKYAGIEFTPPYLDYSKVFDGEEFKNALSTIELIVFHNAHYLTDRYAWRNSLFGYFFNALITQADEQKIKIICESRISLPFETINVHKKEKMYVKGFERKNIRYGIVIFDSQLRRMGLDINHVKNENKELIVRKLGGHPVALTLTANLLVNMREGELIKSLKSRNKFKLPYIDDLVRKLRLIEDEKMFLRILCLGRGAVPKQVIAETVDFSCLDILQNLNALGIINIVEHDQLEISGVLRGSFSTKNLPSKYIDRFHDKATISFTSLSKRNPKILDFAIEAMYHGGLSGNKPDIKLNLIDAVVAVVRELYDKQSYDEAGMMIEQVLITHRTEDLLKLASLVSARRKQYDKSISFAEEVFTSNPNSGYLLTELIRITLSQRDIRTAKNIIHIAKNSKVEEVSIIVSDARILIRENELHAAEKRLLRARKITNKNPWVYYYLGYVYMRMGDFEKAITTFYEGIEFCEKNEFRSRNAMNAMMTQLSLAYLFSGEKENAKTIIDLLLDDERVRPEVQRAYIAYEIITGSIEKANDVIDKLKKLEKIDFHDRSQHHLLLGLYYEGVDDYYHACDEYRKAHKYDVNNVFILIKNAGANYHFAEILWKDGEDSHKGYLQEAIKFIKIILDFDPKNTEGMRIVSLLHKNFDIHL